LADPWKHCEAAEKRPSAAFPLPTGRQANPSPCQARGRLVAANYFKYASSVSSWASGFRLPARSRFGGGRGALHLGIFEQPAKNDLFSSYSSLGKVEDGESQWKT